MIHLFKYGNIRRLVFISALVFLTSCSGLSIYSPSKHTTSKHVLDLFPKETTTATTTIPTNTYFDFQFNNSSNVAKLTQLENWIEQSCEIFLDNWQSCLQNMNYLKIASDKNLEQINKHESINYRNLFLAIHLHNQAELLDNSINDRKQKIKTAHLLIDAKQLLELNQNEHLTVFRHYYINLINLQILSLVQSDSFLAALISPPVIENNNNEIAYLMTNWSIDALNLNYKAMKKTRKSNKLLESDTCLINIEQAIKSQDKLNEKWASTELYKRDNALKAAHSFCQGFPYRFYIFDNIFQLWPNQDLKLKQTALHPNTKQKYIHNNLSTLTSDFIDTYIVEQPNDIFAYYFKAKLNNFIEKDDPCFLLNNAFIKCHLLYDESSQNDSFAKRDFLVNQLVYSFPYELLIHQMTIRLKLHQDELNIFLGKRQEVERSFSESFKSKLMQSNFKNYELKLLYANYAILNHSDDFISKQDFTKITDYFFTEQGYQLKWELSVMVQAILTEIQTTHFISPAQTSPQS